MVRKQPNMTEKLASALLALVEFRNGEWRPTLDRIACKNLTAKEIIAEWEFDHYPISVSMGGNNHPTNLVPMLKEEHREKTANFDAKVHAKIRRAEKRQLKEKRIQVTKSSGNVFEDLELPDAKEQMTEANKAYRKLIYAERKRKRKANMPKAKWARKRED